MGQSASAMLVYGIDFGDEECDDLPDWIASNSDKEYGERGVLSEKAQRLLKEHGLDHYHYGWEFNSNAIGVRLAWALDYGSEEVDLAELHTKAHEIHFRVEAFLRELGAPERFRPGLHLLAQYS